MFDGAEFRAEPENDVVTGLREARDLIARPNGWCQHARRKAGRDGVSYCIVGALGATERDEAHNLRRDEAHNLRMRKHIREALSSSFVGSLPHWNDAPGRTQGEVVAVFNLAIAYARMDGSSHELAKETVNV